MDEFPGYEGYFLDLAGLSEGDSAFYCDGTTGSPGWLVFSNPRKILVAARPEEVEAVLREASDHASDGGFSAGFLSYEASSALNPAVRTRSSVWPVYAWFGLFDEPPALYRELAPFYGRAAVREVRPEIDRGEYGRRFAAVKQALAEGRSYQVNLTFRLLFDLPGESHEFFVSRCGTAPPPYSAFLHGGDWKVASFSPELMFERVGEQVVSRPMKGTALAPVGRGERVAAMRRLASDVKSMAENVMIVDMVRNDLGSLCDIGSVTVDDLFRVRRHGGLLQMTSDVRGKTGAGTDTLVRHLFPAASITGAPKVSTAGLIADLEVSPRHVYCGAVGFMGPGHQRFSVAIRTALLHADGTGEFGVGSGVVWDSDVDSEYEECLAKAEFLTSSRGQWELIEAIGRSDLSDARRVEAHLERLSGAADVFSVPVDRDRILDGLRGVADGDPGLAKVRIAVRRDGEFDVQIGESALGAGPLHAVVAGRPVSSADPNLRFKTTGRAVYESFLDEHAEFDEVLLWNERKEITEFCRGSVVVEIDGQRWSPLPSSGCLESVSVRMLVADGQVRYRTLRLEELERVDAVFFVNAVTGLVRVDLEFGSSPTFLKS